MSNPTLREAAPTLEVISVAHVTAVPQEVSPVATPVAVEATPIPVVVPMPEEVNRVSEGEVLPPVVKTPTVKAKPVEAKPVIIDSVVVKQQAKTTEPAKAQKAPQAPKSAKAPKPPEARKAPVEPETSKVQKPTPAKTALKIGRTAIKTEHVKLAVKRAAAKAPAYKEKLQSVKLKERGSALKKSALGAVAVATTGVKLAPAKLRKLDDSAFDRGNAVKTRLVEKKESLKNVDTAKFKERGSKLKASTVGAVALAGAGIAKAPGKLRPLNDKAINRAKTVKASLAEKKANVSFDGAKVAVMDAPYKYIPRIKTRFSELNESLYENKTILGRAIGVVAIGGIAWAAYKNIDLSGSAPLLEASDATATNADAPVTFAGPSNPTEAAPLAAAPTLEQATSLAEVAPSLGDVVNVSEGGGITDLIAERAAEMGVELNSSEIYEIYQNVDLQTDGNIITGETYRMPNGDLGISSPGEFAWLQDAQRVAEELIEAKKKKKGLG